MSRTFFTAANFTPEGGRITITARRENGEVAIRVLDTGMGIASDQLERVFDLFVQGPPPLDRPQGGLGLGLTLARRLAELHGGTIEARSDGSGLGTEFVVRVPLIAEVSEEGAAKPPVPAAVAPPLARSRRVLVVDDHEDAREALRFLLEEVHYFLTAGDGRCHPHTIGFSRGPFSCIVFRDRRIDVPARCAHLSVARTLWLRLSGSSSRPRAVADAGFADHL